MHLDFIVLALVVLCLVGDVMARHRLRKYLLITLAILIADQLTLQLIEWYGQIWPRQ